MSDDRATIRERLRWWFEDQWEAFVFRLYKTTDRYTEEMMHMVFMDSILDDMKAPRNPDNDKKRPPYGPYGRLNAWCRDNGIRNTMEESFTSPFGP